MKKQLLLLPIVGAFLVVVAGCAPPADLANGANALPSQISEARTHVDEAKKAFLTRLNDNQYSFIKEYSAEQQHADRFDGAYAKLDEANKAHERAKAVTKNYQDSRRSELETAIADATRLKDEARSLGDEPILWVEKVVATKLNLEQATADAKLAADDIAARQVALQGDMTTVKTKFAKQAEGINRLQQPFTDLQASTATAFGNFQTESTKPQPNYVLMTNYTDQIVANQATFNAEEPKARGKIGELLYTETQTLLDVRVDSMIEISRTSWDNSTDRNTDKDYDYPSVAVDMEVADHFATFTPDYVLATEGMGWGGGFTTTEGVERALWDKLGVDPRKDWPGDAYDQAEYTLGELEDTYCHKLFVLVDGKPNISGRPNPAENECSKYDSDADLAAGIYWIDADELDAEAIGMDVFSKPAGEFNDQALEEASPPGMSYVGDPQYGEWQTDPNGNSFWVFYGQYRLFSDLIGGPNPYHYGYEYDEWNKNYRAKRQPYYATSGGAPRYGAKSPLAVARFPNSAFVKSGLKDATVRNAGPAARAGGPGNGGK